MGGENRGVSRMFFDDYLKRTVLATGHQRRTPFVCYRGDAARADQRRSWYNRSKSRNMSRVTSGARVRICASSHVREQAAPLARQGSSALAVLSLHRT
jgi:hypothetical protein